MTYLYICNNEKVLRQAIVSRVKQTIPVRTESLEKITHPDMHFINGFAEESIGIAEVKQFCKVLHKKPFKAPAQLGVILGFERATTEAQNALLKELEEHADNVIYILGVIDDSRLLPTIRSRANTHYVGAQILKHDEKELRAIASSLLDTSSDLLETYNTVSKKDWSRQTTEILLHLLYENLPKNRSSQKKLFLLQRSSEFLKNNISPKQVVLSLFLELRG